MCGVEHVICFLTVACIQDLISLMQDITEYLAVYPFIINYEHTPLVSACFSVMFHIFLRIFCDITILSEKSSLSYQFFNSSDKQFRFHRFTEMSIHAGLQ